MTVFRWLRRLRRSLSTRPLMEALETRVLEPMAKSRKTRRPRRVNWRLVLVTLVLVLLGGVSVYFIHEKQMRQVAVTLWNRAQAEEDAGDTRKAMDYRHRYLQIQPNDLDALIIYCETLEKAAETPAENVQALNAYQRILRAAPSRDDLRRKAALMAMKLRRFLEAEEYWRALVNTDPNDADAWKQLGICRAEERHYDEAIENLQQAIKRDPRQIQAFQWLVAIYQERLAKPDQALLVLEQMVDANPNSSVAFRSRALLRHQLGQQEGASADARRAVELGPDDVQVLLLAAEISLAQTEGNNNASAVQKHRAQARNWLNHAVALRPTNGNAYALLLRDEIQSGQFEKAQELFNTGIDAIKAESAKVILRLQYTDLLVAARRDTAARQQLESLRGSSVSTELLDLLQARLLANENQWNEARRLAEKVRPFLPARSNWSRQTDSLLTEAHRRLGDTQAELISARRIVEEDPTWTPGRQALAAALLRNGQVDQSVQEYRKLCALPDAPPQAFVALARWTLFQTLRLPPPRRDWDKVNRAITEAEKRLPNNWSIQLLRADLHANRNEWAEAEKILNATIQAHPRIIFPRLALIALWEKRQDNQRANILFAEIERDLGDSVELRLARAAHGVRAARRVPGQKLQVEKKLVDSWAELEKNTDRFAPEDRARLQRGLAELALNSDHIDEARRRWQMIATQSPDDITVLLVLVDLARRSNDINALGPLVEQLRVREGDKGARWKYAEALRLLALAEKADQPLARTQTSRARSLLDEVIAQRPGWSQPTITKAQLQHRNGETAQALENFLRAIDNGERDPTVIRFTAQLLYTQRRFVEADQIIRKYLEDPQSEVLGATGRLAAETAFFVRDFERTLTLAQQAAPIESKEYRDHLWRGQILSSIGQPQEAEKAIRQAINLGEDQPECWVALVQHLARSGQLVQARAAALEAEKKLITRSPLSLAQCQLALGLFDRAETFFNAALTAEPREPRVLRAVAEYRLQRGRAREAEPLFRQLLELQDKVSEADRAWANRGLALVVAATGDYSAIQKALDYLQQDSTTNLESAADYRVRARLLGALRTPSARRQALQLFADWSRRQPLAPIDEYLWARLLLANGDSLGCRERMLSVLAADSRNPPEQQNPDFADFFIRTLLVRGNAQEAHDWLPTLERVLPADPRAVELRARLEIIEGQPAAAVARLREFIDAPDISTSVKRARARQTAGLLEESARDRKGEDRLLLIGTAEQLWQQLSVSEFDDNLRFAAFLGRQARTTEGMEICEKATPFEADKVAENEKIAEVITSFLQISSDDVLTGRAEVWFFKACQRNPNSYSLLCGLANVRVVQNRVDEAETLYREVLKKSPRHPVAMNNLAWLLAFRQGRAHEALPLADQLLSMTGPNASIWDTRGIVRLAAGKTEDAIRDFEDALTIAPSPLIRFHLARAYLVADARAKALQAWDQALKAGLERDSLHPLERPYFQQLATMLAPKG